MDRIEIIDMLKAVPGNYDDFERNTLGSDTINKTTHGDTIKMIKYDWRIWI